MPSNKTLFDNLFPSDILSLAENIMKMRKQYNSSVPKILVDSGYCGLRNMPVFLEFNRKIMLYFRTSDSKRKRNEILNSIIQFSTSTDNYTDYELIYGYLRSGRNGDENDTVTLYNKTIKVMSGEILLRYLFRDEIYNQIIRNIGNEINSNFSIVPDLPSAENL